MHINKLHIAMTILTLFLISACNANMPNVDIKEHHRIQAVTEGFANWHNKVLASQDVINTDKNKILESYNQIRNFHHKSMTASWINETASVIAENKIFKKSIIRAARNTPKKFALSLLESPQSVVKINGATNALKDGLSHIEEFDYIYRNLSNAFEDAARGRNTRTLAKHRKVSNISLSMYTSDNHIPSVAEQMLTIAAIKILNLEEDNMINARYKNTFFNPSISNCLQNAQRNSAQCKAASYDKHDLSFCMAKHTIGETSQCFSWILP